MIEKLFFPRYIVSYRTVLSVVLLKPHSIILSWVEVKQVEFRKQWLMMRHIMLSGLEQQLLGIVVRKERPELEEQKDALVTNIAAGKLKLIELEDAVLRSVGWWTIAAF